MSIFKGNVFHHSNNRLEKYYNLIVIGGGPSGLSAAISAYDRGERSILIIERQPVLGGVLNSCLQDGFGFDTFKRSLTGQEYVAQFVKGIKTRCIETALNTTVLELSKDKVIKTVSPNNGIFYYRAKAIVFAAGSREKNRGSLNITGSRPDGVYVSGVIQKMLDDKEKLRAGQAVIFGSDDVGLSLAHRLVNDGVKIKAVIEPNNHLCGSFYNKEKSLDSYDIPLLLSHRIKKVLGNKTIEGVVIEKTDPSSGVAEEETIACDLLIISVGLIPDAGLLLSAGMEISPLSLGPVVNDRYETSVPGLFVSGNALFIHDTADCISKEGFIVGNKAVQYINNFGAQNYYWETEIPSKVMQVEGRGGISYAVPQKIDINKSDNDIMVFFRVKEEIHDKSVKVFISGKEYQTIYKKVLYPNIVHSVMLSKRDIISRINGENNIIIEV